MEIYEKSISRVYRGSSYINWNKEKRETFIRDLLGDSSLAFIYIFISFSIILLHPLFIILKFCLNVYHDISQYSTRKIKKT